MRIVFMGTPAFAVASLDILVKNGYDIVGVITAPDRKSGRGQKVRASAIKEYAVKEGLNILQPTNLKSPEFLEELKALKADLQIVVAFRMLPEVVWNMPRKGTVNLHASLLPQYRGAAPINWAIINGETETGVTTFFIEHKIDTGDLLLQSKTTIETDETAGSLHDKLMTSGADLVLRTVRGIESDSLQPIPQKITEDLRKAPKIFRDDCQIDWTMPAVEIYNMIRGLSPYPAAFTYLDAKSLKIYSAELSEEPHCREGGFYESDGKTELVFYASGGSLSLKVVQMEGKRRMNIDEFLRGYTLEHR